MLRSAPTVADHYNRRALGDVILAALEAAGRDIEHLTPDDLAPVDYGQPVHVLGVLGSLDRRHARQVLVPPHALADRTRAEAEAALQLGLRTPFAVSRLGHFSPCQLTEHHKQTDDADDGEECAIDKQFDPRSFQLLDVFLSFILKRFGLDMQRGEPLLLMQRANVLECGT